MAGRRSLPSRRRLRPRPVVTARFSQADDDRLHANDRPRAVPPLGTPRVERRQPTMPPVQTV